MTPGTATRIAPGAERGDDRLARPIEWDGRLIEAFQSFVDAAVTQPNEENALRVAVEGACALLDVDRCSMFLRVPGSPVFRGVVAQTPEDPEVVHRMMCGVSSDRLSQEIATTGRPVLVSDVAHDDRPVRSTMRRLHVSELLGVPIVSAGLVRGLLFLDTVGARRRFSGADVDRAMAFAALIGTQLGAMESVRRMSTGLAHARARRDLDTKILGDVLDIAMLNRAGKSLDEIVSRVGELAGCACVLTDGARRVVARDRTDIDLDAHRRLLLTQEAADRLHTAGAREPVELATHPESHRAGSTLVVSVDCDGRPWGQLSLVGSSTNLARAHSTILAAAACAISNELALVGAGEQRSEDDRSALGRNLLEGSIDAGVRRRASALGVPLDRPWAVARVEMQDRGEIPCDTHDLVDSFAAIGAADAMIVRDGPSGVEIAVPVDSVDRQEECDRVRSVVQHALDRLGLVEPHLLAVSSPVPNAAALAIARREVGQVMSCLREHCSSVDTLTAADLGFAGTLLARLDRADAELHVASTLGPLLSRERSVADLLSTVESFLDNGRSVRAAALGLGVHENTVRYRLSRVAELAGLDLIGSADDQVRAELALVIRRLRSTGTRHRTTVPPIALVGEASLVSAAAS